MSSQEILTEESATKETTSSTETPEQKKAPEETPSKEKESSSEESSSDDDQSSSEDDDQSSSDGDESSSDEEGKANDDGKTEFTKLNQVRVLKKRGYDVFVASRNKVIKTQASGAVISEIKRLQRSTKLTFRRAPFCRLVREISLQYGTFTFQSQALEAIQESAELFLVGFISDSYMLTKHRKRETLGVEDMQLLQTLVEDLVPTLKKL